MHPPRTQGSQGAALEDLWRQVCASRGTPAPDPGQRAQFLRDLDPQARRTLETVMLLAARGREQPGDLRLLSWAASCMRPAAIKTGPWTRHFSLGPMTTMVRPMARRPPGKPWRQRTSRLPRQTCRRPCLVLPTRFERQRHEPFASAGHSPEKPRLRLFGKASAHTLEVTPHRRGGDFLGVHAGLSHLTFMNAGRRPG